MQTTKNSVGKMGGHPEAPLRKSPVKKIGGCGGGGGGGGSEFDSTTTSPMKASKVVEELRACDYQRRRMATRVVELESQLSQAREGLRKSEAERQKARRESEEVWEKLKSVAAKLECTEAQLHEASESEDERINELRQLGKERDRAWQSELEAIHEQHRIDSGALASAMNEIRRLRLHLEVATKSEAAQTEKAEVALSELHVLRRDMDETLSLAEKFKARVAELEASELKCRELVKEKAAQLEIAADTIKNLQSERKEKSEVEVFQLGEELRKLKKQSEQWRKAAETATAILITEDNGSFIDDIVKPTSSPPVPHDDEPDEDGDKSAKKRSSTVMKKIGVLWKKGQKP